MTDDRSATSKDVQPAIATDDNRDPVDVAADEFAERYRKGEYPSVTEYVLRFPEQADELRELLPAVAMMEQLKSKEESRITSIERQSVISGLKQLGDFRIIREIGHGGMGVVYEAEQESLGRRVALKVLSPATLNSPKSIRRFRREAETVARLHHSNIVPVFGVGDEKGLYYYVMQLIEGEPLNQVISGLRDKSGRTTTDGHADTAWGEPTASPMDGHSLKAADGVSTDESADDLDNRPVDNSSHETVPLDRSMEKHLASATERLSSLLETGNYWNAVAEIGIQVARALEYAHGHGVWHRDIKPSNLLIDQSRTVWIVDFGLARLAEDNELTMTGDILGTLRYMSPEQIVGQFDQRSDVYSLGLTLYELLTFRPAHDASIRSRIMQQISEANPTSPRQINPAIPKDLETIILKATIHNASDRYQSASDLADDLQRFAGGFPIQARRFSPVEQLWRWSRRNPALAWTTATTLILLVTVAAVSTWGLVTARSANRELMQERGRTGVERDRAEDNLSLALLAFEEIVDGLSQRGIPQSVQSDLNSNIDGEAGAESKPIAALTPAVTEADAELLNRLLRFYIDFASRNEASPEVASQTAKAQRRVGDIYRRLGRHEDAIAAYDNARTQYQTLSQRELNPDIEEMLLNPDEPASYSATLTVAGISNQIGEVAALVGDVRTASEAFMTSSSFLTSLPIDVQSRPETRFVMAQTMNSFALLQGRPGFRISGPEFGGPGFRGPDSGDPPRDRDPRGGHPVPGRPVDSRPRDSGPRDRVAEDRGSGHRTDRVGDLADRPEIRQPPGPGRGPGSGPPREIEYLMEATRRDARDLLEQLIEEDSDNPQYKVELAKSLLAGASSHDWSQESRNPLQDLEAAIAILETLAQQEPGNPDYQFQLADALALSSPETERHESVESAASRFARSIDIARKLQNQFPNAAEYDILLANSLRRLSGIQNDLQQLSGSQASVDEAVVILRRLTQVWPGHVIYRLSLARTLQHSAMLERRLKNSELSLELLEEAVVLFDDVASFDDQPVSVSGLLSMIHRSRSEILRHAGRNSEADKAWKLADKLLPCKDRGPGGLNPRGRGFGPPGGPERIPQPHRPPDDPSSRAERKRPADDLPQRDLPQRPPSEM
ncbi:MAG: protein kinase [Planctomycetota bacterium]|nr:protein kinase [Planctomycetota bacterium]